MRAFSDSYLGLGCVGSSPSRKAQTSSSSTSEVFPNQPRDIISPVYPGFTPGFLLVRHAQNTSAGSCQCGRLFNNFICTAQRNLKEHFLIRVMFHFHQTIWHPFLPNTLSSTYQCRYQRDFYFFNCDVMFSKCSLIFLSSVFGFSSYFTKQSQTDKKKGFLALLVAV